MKAIIDLEKVTKLLIKYLDPYDFPGAMDAIIESLQELVLIEEEHNDTQISGE